MLPNRSCPANRLVRAAPVLIATLTVAATAALALAWQSVHADGVLAWRTYLIPKDRARVARVTKLPDDFSKPERFESMMGEPQPRESSSTATPSPSSRPI